MDRRPLKAASRLTAPAFLGLGREIEADSTGRQAGSRKNARKATVNNRRLIVKYHPEQCVQFGLPSRDHAIRCRASPAEHSGHHFYPCDDGRWHRECSALNKPPIRSRREMAVTGSRELLVRS